MPPVFNLLLLLTNEFGAGEKESDRFSFPSGNCSLDNLFVLSQHCCLACVPKTASWDASQSVSFNGREGRAGSISNQSLPSTLKFRRLRVVTLEFPSAELFEGPALNAAPGPSLQRVWSRFQESAFLTSTSQVVLC